MTPEQLLTPRYKVIKMWPEMGERGYQEGQIITLDGHYNKQRYAVVNGNHIYDVFLDTFPHLFELMKWWEGRTPNELPEYVRWDYKPMVDQIRMKDFIREAEGWVQAGHGVKTEGQITATKYWLPAAEQEYRQSRSPHG